METGVASESEKIHRHAREDAEGFCVFVESPDSIVPGAAFGTSACGVFPTVGLGFWDFDFAFGFCFIGVCFNGDSSDSTSLATWRAQDTRVSALRGCVVLGNGSEKGIGEGLWFFIKAFDLLVPSAAAE
jgi:hypothetical protein